MKIKSLRLLSLAAFSSGLAYVLYKLPFSFFSYHPLCMIVGVLLTTEGTTLLQSKKSAQNKDLHGYLQSASFLLLLGGFYVIYTNKELNNKLHFQTAHGQLGSLTFVYMLVQVLIGSIVTNLPLDVTRKRVMYKYHRISGYTLIGLLWITTYFGAITQSLLISPYLIYIYSISTVILFISIFPY